MPYPEIDIEKYKKAMEEALNTSVKDQETGHFMADEVLCDLIDDLGFQEITALYQRVFKYYS